MRYGAAVSFTWKPIGGLGGFFQCQLKEEIARKTFGVAFDRLNQGSGLDPVQSCKIGVQDDPLLANTTNQRCDSRWSPNFGIIAHAFSGYRVRIRRRPLFVGVRFAPETLETVWNPLVLLIACLSPL